MTQAAMKRKVSTRRTGEKSRKCVTSTLQELSSRRSFFFDKKHESHQRKEPLCSLPKRYSSQKGYFLLSTLRFMAACLIQGSIGTVIPRSQCREHPVVLWPDICDNSGQILVIIGQLFMKIYTTCRISYIMRLKGSKIGLFCAY